MHDTRHSEFVNSITHWVGFFLSIAALVLLVVFGALRGNAWHVVGFSLFGASLILLYFASAFYHSIPRGTRLKKIFQKIDHAMIYILIVGTYAPICFLFLPRPWGWSIFGSIMGLALFGIVLKTIPHRSVAFKRISYGLYILMGWLIVIAAHAFFPSLSGFPLFLLVAGGTLYTLGAFICAFDKVIPQPRWFGTHEAFHMMTLFASGAHVWLFLYLLPG